MSGSLLQIDISIPINLGVNHVSNVLMYILVVIVNNIICLYDSPSFLAVHVNIHYVVVSVCEKLLLLQALFPCTSLWWLWWLLRALSMQRHHSAFSILDLSLRLLRKIKIQLVCLHSRFSSITDRQMSCAKS